MDFIQKRLFALRDAEYALFQSKLTPGVAPDSFIGVRVPECRKLAKALYKSEPDAVSEFLVALPHRYYRESYRVTDGQKQYLQGLKK